MVDFVPPLLFNQVSPISENEYNGEFTVPPPYNLGNLRQYYQNYLAP